MTKAKFDSVSSCWLSLPDSIKRKSDEKIVAPRARACRFNVPHDSQHDCYRRTEINNNIHLIDKTVKDDPNSAMIKNNLTKKCITPFIVQEVMVAVVFVQVVMINVLSVSMRKDRAKRGAGASALATEIVPKCALQACTKGSQVVMMESVVGDDQVSDLGELHLALRSVDIPESVGTDDSAAVDNRALTNDAAMLNADIRI